MENIIEKLIWTLREYWQGIVAISALSISVSEFLVTRRHNRLSVTPRIDTFVFSKPIPPGDRLNQQGWDEHYLAVRIMNKGVGPADIQNFTVIKDGKPITDDFERSASTSVQEILGPRGQQCTTTSLIPGYLMSPGETLDLFAVQFPIVDRDDIQKLRENLNRYDLIVMYSSLYKSKFAYDSRKDGRKRHKGH